MMEPEQISIESFKQFGHGRGKAAHPTLQLIKDMTPGVAMIVDHYGSCKRTEAGFRSCSMNSMVGYLSRTHATKSFSSRHMPDGRMAVACFPKEG